MSDIDSANLQQIVDLLNYHLSYVGFGQGFGLGVVCLGSYLLFAYLRKVSNDVDE